MWASNPRHYDKTALGIFRGRYVQDKQDYLVIEECRMLQFPQLLKFQKNHVYLLLE